MKKEQVRKYASILLVGLLYALRGAVATATLALGILTFFYVNQERGYIAVGLFVVALLIVTLGLIQFYKCGRDMTGGKFSK